MPIPEKEFRAAVGALPPLLRTVFLLSAADGLSYGVIAERLSISLPSVQDCLTEALYMIGSTLDDRKPRRWRLERSTEAETQLRQRYRRHCEGRLREIGVSTSIPWGDDGGDDATAVRALDRALSPIAVARFVVNEMPRLRHEAIAQGKFPFTWEMARRTLAAFRRASRPPLTFDQWLHGIAHQSFADAEVSASRSPP